MLPANGPQRRTDRPTPLERLGRTWAGLLSVIAYLMAILLALITLSVLYEIVARSYFNRPTVWAVDFSEYGLVYVTFLGAAWVLHQHAHVRVDLLLRFLDPRARLALSVIVSLAAAAVLVVFVWKGTELVIRAFLEGQVMLKAWRVPRWLILLPIPVGSLLMLIEFLRQGLENFQAWRAGVPADVSRRVEVGEVEVEDERAIL